MKHKGNLNRQEVREHILKVSKEMFLERGYLNTSIRDIAREGDLTVGRIYVYFKKKDDIFMEIIRPFYDAMCEYEFPIEIDEEFANNKVLDLFIKDRFKNIFYEVFNFVNTYRDELVLAFFKSEGFSKFDIREEILKLYIFNYNKMMDVLKEKGYMDNEIDIGVSRTIGKLYVAIYEELALREMSKEELEIYSDNMASYIYFGNLGMMNKVNIDIDFN